MAESNLGGTIRRAADTSMAFKGYSEFLGHIKGLEVWLHASRTKIMVVGSKERLLDPNSEFNFDVFYCRGSNLVESVDPKDVHIDVHDMCLLYDLCVQHKLLDEDYND